MIDRFYRGSILGSFLSAIRMLLTQHCFVIDRNGKKVYSRSANITNMSFMELRETVGVRVEYIEVASLSGDGVLLN